MTTESANALSSRAIIAEYFLQLEQNTGIEWVNAISMLLSSNQESETYKWLSSVPSMREWVGGRVAKSLTSEGITITNVEYESTLQIGVKELMNANAGKFRIRIADHVQRALSHDAKLLSTLLINAPSSVCYDGQYFFDTDHVTGDSGTQSNDISVTIANLAAQVHGSTTSPSPEEMSLTILKGITQIVSLLDDQGEPMNEDASQFLVMVPPSLLTAATAAATADNFASNADNVLKKSSYSVKVIANPRLSAWTTSFAIFRTDSQLAPLIRQENIPLKVSAVAEGSEFEHFENKHQYGLYASKAVGYGRWEYACYVTMV